MSHSTHNRSFPGRVFPANRLAMVLTNSLMNDMFIWFDRLANVTQIDRQNCNVSHGKISRLTYFNQKQTAHTILHNYTQVPQWLEHHKQIFCLSTSVPISERRFPLLVSLLWLSLTSRTDLLSVCFYLYAFFYWLPGTSVSTSTITRKKVVNFLLQISTSTQLF